jgi:sarcosine oxidase subunit gamma
MANVSVLSAIRRPLVLPPRDAAPAIRLLEPAARFALRIREKDRAGLKEVAGFPLGLALNTCAGTDRMSLHLGPDEYWLIAPNGHAGDLQADIAAALGARFHALVDISHRNVAMEISGAGAIEVLNGGIARDLSATAFPTGSAARTLCGKAEIVLARIGDAPRYRVECWRSFAPYIGAFFADLARDFDA